MNIRFTSATVLGLVFIGTSLAGCDKSAPTPSTPPPNNTRAPAPAPTPPPIHLDQKPTTPTLPPPATAPVTAPISMKPTDVHPTTSPPAPFAAHTAVPVQPTLTVPADPMVAVFAGFTAPKPATWAAKPMTKADIAVAKFIVPGRDGSDQAEISVTKAGGALQANIDRWKGQFKGADGKPAEPKTSTLTVGDMSITLVEFAGSYSGMTGSSKPDHLGLIGIIENPGENIFIKFVGPTATVEGNRQEFMDMLNGIKRADAQK